MRAMVPIYIESNNEVIKSTQDIDNLKNSRPSVYKELILSKELSHFYYGLSLKNKIEEAQKEYESILKEEKNGFVDNILLKEELNKNIEFLFIKLLPKKYFIKSMSKNIHILGYHVQKTILFLEEDLVLDVENVKFSNISFIGKKKDIKIIVSSNSRIKFNNIVFGEVELVVQDKAKIWLNNIMCNGATRGIVQKDSGCIEEATNIDFNRNKYNYYIENFYSITMKNVNKQNLNEIEELFLYSYIENFFVEEDIDLSGIKELHIVNKTNFKAISNCKYYKLSFGEVFLSNNIFIDKNILVSGNFIVNEITNKIFSLGMFVGNIFFSNSQDICIYNTFFVKNKKTSDSPVEILNSSIVFDSIFAVQENSMFKIINSKVTIIRSKLENRKKLFYFVFKRNIEDDIFKEDNQCNIIDSKIKVNTLALADNKSVYPIYYIKNSHIVGNSTNNTMETFRDSNIIGSVLSNPFGCACYIKSSKANIQNTYIEYSKIGIKADQNALVTMSNNHIENNNVGLYAFDSITFQKEINLFKNNKIAIDLAVCADEVCYKKVLLYYVDTIFKNNQQDFNTKPGVLKKRIDDNQWKFFLEKEKKEHKNVMDKEDKLD